MKMIFGAVALCLFASGAHAKDVALILNDQEQASLRQVLDIATRADGLQIAPLTVYLLRKLEAAGVVTNVKPKDDAKPDEPKKESSPSDDVGETHP